MTQRRASTIRVEEEITNEGVPPQGNQAPPNEQVPLVGQVPVNPTVMTDGEIRVAFLTLTQVMATQAQVVTTQAQAMPNKLIEKLDHV